MKPGDRVEMTEKGLRMELDGIRKRRTGVVRRIYPCGLVQIKRDKEKMPAPWHPDFWRVIEKETMKPGDQVEMSAKGIAAGLDGIGKHRTGVIVGRCLAFSRLIRVRRDDGRGAILWDRQFWKKAEEKPCAGP